MLRKLLGAGLLLAALAGCKEPDEGSPVTCSVDADCGDGGACDLDRGLCYEESTDPEDPDGGTCVPSCAAYEACTTSGVCRPRFTALSIQAPANNAILDGGTVQVVAELVKNDAYASTEFPPTLAFDALRAGGGERGTFGTQTRDGGIYSIPWTPPASQASFTLTAAHPVPDAGLSTSVNVTVDTLAPTFEISLSNPPMRATGSATQAEQRDLAFGTDGVYRRDESVTITVSANEEVRNVVLTLVGIGPGGPGQEMTVDLSSPGTCTGTPPFCRSATVALSTPEMKAFRGTMVLRVTGVDVANNQGTASKNLPVTRWKWAFDAVDNLVSTPAVGGRGTVYFGTNKFNGSGQTFAVSPDGKQEWQKPTGDVVASPAVGAFGTDEFVYVAARSGSSPFLYAFRGSTGAEAAKCAPSASGSFASAVAVGSTEVQGVVRETGFAINNSSGTQGVIEWVRPDAAQADQCVAVSGGTNVPPATPGSAVLVKELNIFYATFDFKVTSFDLATFANTPRNGWPQSTGEPARGLAVLNDQIYGAAGDTTNPAEGDLFSIPTAGQTVSLVYPATMPNSRVFNLAIGTAGADNIAYFGAETSSTQELLSLSLNTGGEPNARTGIGGSLRGAPVIAKNNRLYTFSTSGTAGRVVARVASTLALQWDLENIPVVDNPDAFVSPTLDCHRDATGQVTAGLGTLYIAAGTKLYAFVVDSPGLDPNAPWPKYQHDVRNTGNPATPITDCP